MSRRACSDSGTEGSRGQSAVYHGRAGEAEHRIHAIHARLEAHTTRDCTWARIGSQSRLWPWGSRCRTRPRRGLLHGEAGFRAGRRYRTGGIWLALPGHSGQRVELVQHGPGSAFDFLFGVADLRSTASSSRRCIFRRTSISRLSIQDPDGNQSSSWLPKGREPSSMFVRFLDQRSGDFADGSVKIRQSGFESSEVNAPEFLLKASEVRK